MPAFTPIFDGADIGAAGTNIFDFSATGIMGQFQLKNSGPGVIALNLTGVAPADTTRGADRITLQSGDTFNKGGIRFTTIAVRADAAGAGVDVSAQPSGGSGLGIG